MKNKKFVEFLINNINIVNNIPIIKTQIFSVNVHNKILLKIGNIISVIYLFNYLIATNKLIKNNKWHNKFAIALKTANNNFKL